MQNHFNQKSDERVYLSNYPLVSLSILEHSPFPSRTYKQTNTTQTTSPPPEHHWTWLLLLHCTFSIVTPQNKQNPENPPVVLRSKTKIIMCSLSTKQTIKLLLLSKHKKTDRQSDKKYFVTTLHITLDINTDLKQKHKFTKQNKIRN